MKMHCYFLLNVKRGASQLYLGGGGLQLSSAGTDREHRTKINRTRYGPMGVAHQPLVRLS